MINCCCSGGTTCSSSLCWQIDGCSGMTGQSISVTDPLGTVHTSGSNPYCLTGTLHTGSYTYTTSASGYFTRTADVFTFTCDTTHTITVNLTPTSLGINVTGCGLPDGFPGCSVVMTGGYNATCTTDGSGNCTLAFSNGLDCGDTWTITITPPSIRFKSYTQSGSCPCTGDAIGCTGPCFIGPIYLDAADGFNCCLNSCYPICNTYTFSTPFGSCTTTIGSTGLITCTFVKSVLGWPNVLVSGTTYRVGCGITGVTQTMVNVTFTVTYNPCVGTLSIHYFSCGTSCSGQSATQDLPSGASYSIAPSTTTCTYSGTPICPPSVTSGGYTVSGTGYCNGTYTATESCGPIPGEGGTGGGTDEAVAPRSFPGPLTMAKNLGKAVVAHVADGGRKAGPDVQASRKAICEACPLHEPASDRCKPCGCYLGIKRSWASESCPEGKW